MLKDVACFDPVTKLLVDHKAMLAKLVWKVSEYAYSPSVFTSECLTGSVEDKLMLTTRCYCITSKFPFYKLHLQVSFRMQALISGH